MAVEPGVDLDALHELTRLADYVVPFAIRVACDLGVADHLAEGPRTVDDLAEATGAHAPSLHRLLRALAGEGVFAETEPGVFGLTQLAQPLLTAHPLSLRAAYPLLPADINALARIDWCLRDGRAAFDRVYGEDYWSHLSRHPDQSAAVDAWMAGLNRVHLRTVASARDWGAARTVVDVGGGNGAFLAGLLARHHGLRGVLLDLPHVVAAAPGVLAEAGVADRCEIVPGSFFEQVPAGADLYVLKTVLPGWPDPQARSILRTIRAAMPATGTLVLLEAVIADDEKFDVAKLVDVHTLVVSGGRHRDRRELAALLAEAGFDLRRVVPTPTLTLVEAIPTGRESTG
ncbi:methyltransferase [Nonomuraea purpurea]|uniref:Methyltransferase n=1 Tax=Nonomuraea purpurea TaxID=1849276 RepID=A0ABV8GME7_9ACTN